MCKKTPSLAYWEIGVKWILFTSPKINVHICYPHADRWFYVYWNNQWSGEKLFLTSNETSPEMSFVHFFPRYNSLNVEYDINVIGYRLRGDVSAKFRRNSIELYNDQSFVKYYNKCGKITSVTRRFLLVTNANAMTNSS